MTERTLLREMLVNLLKGNTAAGGRVFDSRLVSWDGDELPGISVSTPTERGTAKTASQIPTFETSLNFNIEVAIAETEGWAAKLDALCERVLEIIFCSPQFNSRISRVSTYAINFEFKAEGEVGFVSAVISFDVEFLQMFVPSLDDVAVPFERAHVELDDTIGADYDIS